MMVSLVVSHSAQVLPLAKHRGEPTSETHPVCRPPERLSTVGWPKASTIGLSRISKRGCALAASRPGRSPDVMCVLAYSTRVSRGLSGLGVHYPPRGSWLLLNAPLGPEPLGCRGAADGAERAPRTPIRVIMLRSYWHILALELVELTARPPLPGPSPGPRALLSVVASILQSPAIVSQYNAYARAVNRWLPPSRSQAAGSPTSLY